MQVGAFMESRLGMTAFAHLALCSDDILYCDFDTPLMFTEDPVSGGMTYHENGVVKVPETPGLGAWIEENILVSLRISFYNQNIFYEGCAFCIEHIHLLPLLFPN